MRKGINPFTDKQAIREAFEEDEKVQQQCVVDGDVIRFKVGGGYKIVLKHCDTPEKVLDWVDHLCEKSWMTTRLIQQFVVVACGAHAIEYHDIT